MIRHDAIGQQPATGEIFIHPQKNPELLPLRIPKHKPPIHHPRNAVVNRRFHQRFFPRDQPSRTTHAPKLSQSPLIARRILIICLSPSHMRLRITSLSQIGPQQIRFDTTVILPLAPVAEVFITKAIGTSLVCKQGNDAVLRFSFGARDFRHDSILIRFHQSGTIDLRGASEDSCQSLRVDSALAPTPDAP